MSLAVELAPNLFIKALVKVRATFKPSYKFSDELFYIIPLMSFGHYRKFATFPVESVWDFGFVFSGFLSMAFICLFSE